MHTKRRAGACLRAGSREDLERLFRENARAVLGYAIRRGEQPADAAEIVSEVMLVAWRRLGEVPAGEQGRFWLLGTARNLMLNQARAERRRSNLGDRLRAELAVAEAAARHSDDGLRDSVMAAMRQLPEADREVLLLDAWEELRPAEIAVVLGIPVETARSRLHRARRRLRAALEPSIEGASPPRDAGKDM
jgi:RNA polymerase sigma-70 factor (ECF subfamily)